MGASDTMKRNPQYGSDVIVDLMKAYDIEYAAFNPGSSFRGIHDSIVNYGGNRNPEVIFCCHEEIAVAVAHGYGKAKGKPMVAIVHDLVGLLHASMAVFNAWGDRVPVIVMGATGPMDAARRRPGTDWTHTALVQGTVVRDYVKWDDQPYTLASVPMSFIRGYRSAVTEPKGPVYLCYDTEIQEEAIREKLVVPEVSRFAPSAPVQANPEALRQAARLLVDAKFPLIIAEHLGRNHQTVNALVELAELLSIPVIDKVSSRKANGYNFPNTHALDVTDSGTDLLKKADVILALDVIDLFGSLSTIDKATRRAGYVIGPSTKIIHISVNDLRLRSWASDYQYLMELDVPITAETSVAVPELVRLCREMLGKDSKKKEMEERFKAVKETHDRLRAKWLEEARATASRKEIATAWLALELWESVKKEDFVLVNGTANLWARRLWEWTKPYQYLGHSGGGGLGYELPASIGAALAYRGTDKICVDIQDDGATLYTPSALWTAAHHQIPILIVMYNNQSYFNSEDHAVKMAMSRNRAVEKAGIGTHVDNPPVDFSKMAESYGIYGEGPIRRPADVRPAIQRALKVVKEKRVPALVDVITEAR